MLELIDVESVSDRQLDPHQYEQKNNDAQASDQSALVHSGDYSQLSLSPQQQPRAGCGGEPFEPGYTLLDQ
jgi:hypothetical protein